MNPSTYASNDDTCHDGSIGYVFLSLTNLCCIFFLISHCFCYYYESVGTAIREGQLTPANGCSLKNYLAWFSLTSSESYPLNQNTGCCAGTAICLTVLNCISSILLFVIGIMALPDCSEQDSVSIYLCIFALIIGGISLFCLTLGGLSPCLFQGSAYSTRVTVTVVHRTRIVHLSTPYLRVCHVTCNHIFHVVGICEVICGIFGVIAASRPFDDDDANHTLFVACILLAAGSVCGGVLIFFALAHYGACRNCCIARATRTAREDDASLSNPLRPDGLRASGQTTRSDEGMSNQQYENGFRQPMQQTSLAATYALPSEENGELSEGGASAVSDNTASSDSDSNGYYTQQSEIPPSSPGYTTAPAYMPPDSNPTSATSTPASVSPETNSIPTSLPSATPPPPSTLPASGYQPGTTELASETTPSIPSDLIPSKY